MSLKKYVFWLIFLLTKKFNCDKNIIRSLILLNLRFRKSVIIMMIGDKIKSLRLMYSLTQEELANRTELTKGYISQLERDLTSPSISTLVDILSCLGTDLNEFFSDKKNEQIVFRQKDFGEKVFEDVGSSVTWLIPSAQTNMMEPILVSIEPDGSTIPHDPHEGEEFGYVIKGTIFVSIGGRKHRVRSGESFYFKPHQTHFLINEGKKQAKVIWVAQPPSF